METKELMQKLSSSVEKVYRKVFGPKCGLQRYGKNSEEGKKLSPYGINSSVWEINNKSTLGRTQIYLSEKFFEEESPLVMEIYKDYDKKIEGWSITDDELTYYFFINPKYVYKVRSNWLWNLAVRIQDYTDKSIKFRNWISKIKRSSTFKTKFEIYFGVPCMPVEIEVEFKSNGSTVECMMDWKQAINKLKMDIEKIKI